MTATTGRHRAPRGARSSLLNGTDPLVAEAPKVPIRTIFRRFWPQTRPFRGRLGIGLLLAAIAPAIDAAGIWMFKVLIDDVLTPGDFRLFPMVAAAYVGIGVAAGVLTFVDSYLWSWVGERFVLLLRTDLFAHLHRMSLSFFERRQLGDVMSRLSSDVSAIEQLVLSGVAQFIAYSVRFVVFTGLLFYLSWQLALAAFAAAPLFVIASRYFARRMQAASREKRRRSGTISAVAEESLGNAVLVQAYGREKAETERFHRENLGAFAAQMVATRLKAMFSPLTGLLEMAGVLLVIGLGVWQLASGAMTLGGLLVFLAYLSQLYSPIQGLSSLTNSVFAASASAERIIEVQDEKPSVTDPPNPRQIGRARGALRLDAVTFAYPGVDRPALTDLRIDVAPGQRLAVVGPSGAGKTSLTKLLLRFYDPQHGRVLLDGVDLRELALADLRRNVAAVLQETLVFDGTIRDNILWGRPEARERDVIAAAVAADADTFIRSLPDGYGTRVGQRGRALSGGQRQRLAIARAMIRDAPLLLLDEPTTGLDAASTQRVLAPLRRLMQGRTTILISHNLLTVADADTIVYLEQGRILGTGTHQQLLASCPGYAHLYRLHHQPAAPRARTGGPAFRPPHPPVVQRMLP